MLILGIETSCDETAASVVEDGQNILSNIVASQIDVHRRFGGVVPELASRKHIECINLVVEEALSEAKVNLSDISACAVTYGPGLVGSLLIGLSFAKGLAYSQNIPLLGINHLEGHIYATYLDNPQLVKVLPLCLPAIALVVSGGHTELVQVNEWGNYKLLGRTIDDAVGEAFDKAAKLLDLGYPGGPIIDILAKEGNSQAVKFPRALWRKRAFDFSLSGLKTSLIYFLRGLSQNNMQCLSQKDIVASFQEAIVDVLIDKTVKVAKDNQLKNIILCGGVAANTRLKQRLSEEAQKEGMMVYYPSIKLCTDNAAMIAGLGYVQYQRDEFAPLSLNADPNLKL